ncbi:unnamed protein product, partial [Prorocentrum cordatum]
VSEGAARPPQRGAGPGRAGARLFPERRGDRPAHAPLAMQLVAAAGAALLSLALLPPGARGRSLRHAAGRRDRGGGGAPGWDYSDDGKSWRMGQCCAGAGQSPINISEAARHSNTSAGPRSLFYRYDRYYRPITMRNDGRVLAGELEGPAGGFALGAHYPAGIDAEYELWRLEIHSPSEHTFLGKRVDLEVQLFHRLAGASEADAQAPNHTAVVSLGYASSLQPSPISRPPAVLDALRQGGLPQEEGAETLVNGDSSVFVDLARAFQPLPGQAGAAGGGGQAFWQYTGSLTSPPCTADVQWFVRSSPLPARPDALEAYRRALQAGRGLERAAEAGNARALQPSCGARLTRWAAEAAFQDSAAEEKESNEAAFRRAEADNVGNEDALANAIGGTGPVSTAESQARLDYERCAQAIASSEAELQGAARQAAAECDGAVATASYLGEVGTEASGALNSVQQAQCASSQAVAARLRIQAEVQKRTCRALKRKADAAQR